VGERLCEAIDLRAGERVLDVAAGNGNATLAAARRFADVTSTDYVDALLDRGRERAAAERLAVSFRQADAEALPFPDGDFDVAVSTFGVMFTPNQEKAAAELARVVRKGGRVGLANWTPDGFIGQLFKTIGKHVPPPAGVKSPALWGTDARLGELFPGHKVKASKQVFNFRYGRPGTGWRCSAPSTARAPAPSWPSTFERDGLERDLLEPAGAHRPRRRGRLVVPGEYLEVVVTRR
jgi:SAM-dependent methyltransferase